MTEASSNRVACIAGTRPKSIPAITDTSAEKPRTLQSSPRSMLRGTGSGRSAARMSRKHRARQHQAGRAAQQRQQHRLHQELGDELSLAGAEGESHRDLLATVHRARQQEGREVGARDDEDEPDDHHQHPRNRNQHLVDRRIDDDVRRRASG